MSDLILRGGYVWKRNICTVHADGSTTVGGYRALREATLREKLLYVLFRKEPTRLGSYVDESTPEKLAQFLIRQSAEAEKLALRVEAAEAALTSSQAKLRGMEKALIEARRAISEIDNSHNSLRTIRAALSRNGEKP